MAYKHQCVSFLLSFTVSYLHPFPEYSLFRLEFFGILRTMDSSQLTPQELIQIQSLVNRMRQPTGEHGFSSTARGAQSPTVITSGDPLGVAPIAPHSSIPTNNDTPLHPSQNSTTSNPLFLMSTGPIQPYQSARTTQEQPTPTTVQPYQGTPLAHTAQGLPVALRGHPSPVTVLPGTGTSSSMQPFLGRDSLGVGMASQVNQQRRASASSHLPRRHPLVTRGSRHPSRGPATSTPRLARGPNINDCLVAAPDGSGGHAVRVKVKVYPPQVSSYMLFISIR